MTEGRVKNESPVGAGERTGYGGVQIGDDGLSIANCNQVDVLTKPSVRKVGAGKRGATDEVDSVAKFSAEEGKQV